jgi:antitoxin component HigA of HigAB toxin-antitoxin module
MKMTVIKNDKEYEKGLLLIDELFDKKVHRESHDGNQVEKLLKMIADYENKKYQIRCTDTI